MGGMFGGGAQRPAGPRFNTGLRSAPRPMAPRAPSPTAPRQNMAAGMAGMMSDERSKKRIAELEDLNDQYASLLDTPAATANVKPKAPPAADLDRSNARALGEAGSYSYEYKDPGAPGAAPGRHAGPMAQELEGIPGVVGAGPDGLKRVDTGRLALATASATGDQERRLRRLEGGARPGPSAREQIDQMYALDDAQRGLKALDRLDELRALEDDYSSLSDEDAELSRDLAAGEQRALANIRGGR